MQIHPEVGKIFESVGVRSQLLELLFLVLYQLSIQTGVHVSPVVEFSFLCVSQ